MKSLSLTLSLFIFSLASFSQGVNNLKLKNYRPESIYNVQKTDIKEAKYPIIDVHAHDYPENEAELDQWVSYMDEYNIEKSIILTYSTGKKFDSLVNKFSKYPERFDLWCGFDYTGYKSENWPENALKELERCKKMGAKGVGELGDKGLGLFYSDPTKGYGMHLDDPRMKPLLEKCGELNMPVNVHVAEPKWMYEPMDSTNDGLMNAYKWKIDLTQPGILDHGEMIETLENAVKDHPETTFIACHLANCSYDLSILGRLFDQYPNLYADVSARFAEFSPVPRRSREFFIKYQNRLLYGTDMGIGKSVYDITLRILQTADEHFYSWQNFSYHWPLYGLDLPDEVLRKIYGENARRIMDNP